MSRSRTKRESPLRTLLSLRPYFRRYRGRFVVGILFIALTVCFTLVTPWIFKVAIDSLEEGKSAKVYALMLIGAVAIQGVFRFLMRYTLIGTSRSMEYDLRNDLFGHLQTLSAEYYSRTKTGDLMARATNDLSAVRMFLGPGVMQFFNTIFTLGTGLGFMLAIDVKLTVYTLIPLPALSIFVHKFGSVLHKRFESVQQEYSALSARVHENLSGIRVVKSFAREDTEFESFRGANETFVSRNLRMARTQGFFMSFMGFSIGVITAFILYQGGLRKIEGAITLGGLVAFLGYFAMLTWPMMALGWVLSLLQRGAASMGRLNEILQEVPSIVDPAEPRTVESIQGALTFDKVHFSYNGKEILRGIDLTVPAGTSLAIVGATGCGKSSLLNLIPRIRDVSKGEIQLDGVDIRKLPLETLRGSIGYVPQETFLFSETIEANIGFGLAELDERTTTEAAEISQIGRDAQDFPKGLKTFVGERGVTLSGGQKQRVALSRALARGPSVLLLDDALSSVDTVTEDRILRGLGNSTKEITRIIVSHRISTIMHSDQIAVMEEGRIVELGDHTSLMNRDGMYAELYRQQKLVEELERS